MKRSPSLPVAPRLGTRGRPELSRAAILRAAIMEFSKEGVAGARTDAIARAARVNKALLYYYFKDKDALYGAVLDEVFGGLSLALDVPLSSDLAPREKVLAYARAHFDYIALHPMYPRVVQGEMMSMGRGRSPHIERVVRQYFMPLMSRLAELLRQGIASGEFRAVDPAQFIPSMIAVIIFYFINAPIMRLVTGVDPLSVESIAARRNAVLDFIASALFVKTENVSEGARG